MHFTRKNIVGKNMIFSIQNSNAKRQPMNMTNPIHSASARLQFQYSKPNIRQNNHLMSTNMQYSVVKPKGQRLWSPVVHQKLKTRMYCNTVYECNPDYGTCSATTKGLQTYQDCSNTCHITNFYTCDAEHFLCKLDASAAHDASGFKSTCKTNCFEHYDCCNNTGTCKGSGIRGPYTDKLVCDTSCANFGCNRKSGKCERGLGKQNQEDCEKDDCSPYYTCDQINNYTCVTDASGEYTDKRSCDASCVEHYDCCGNTGTCESSGLTGQYTDISVCDTSCANFGCNRKSGKCERGLGKKNQEDCEKDDCSPYYTCDQINNYTCVTDASGEYHSEQECEQACKKHYDCCGNTGTCNVSGLSGEYIDFDACDASCATFACNREKGECERGLGKQNKAQCQGACELNKYWCNPDLGKCDISAGGTPQTKVACDGVCKQMFYTCNGDLGACIEDKSSTQSKAACDGACTQNKYSCEWTTDPLGKCVQDPFGTQTKAQCDSSCKPCVGKGATCIHDAQEGAGNCCAPGVCEWNDERGGWRCVV